MRKSEREGFEVWPGRGGIWPAVEKEELARRIWPVVAVEEARDRDDLRHRGTRAG